MVIRICLLAPEFLPSRGGVGTYSVELAKEIAKRVDLTVLTVTRTDSGPAYSRQEMEAALDHRATVLPIAEARDGFVYNARFQYAVFRRLPQLQRAERFDVVHTQHAHMPDLLWGFRSHRPPLVRTVHSTIPGQREAIRTLLSLGGSPDPTERWQVVTEPYLRSAERIVLGRPGPLIAVSEWGRNQLLQDGYSEARIRVIHNGVDARRFSPEAALALPEEYHTPHPRVLLLGRPTLHKGGAIALRALPLVIAGVPDVELAFTGGATRERLESLTSEKPPWDHIRLLGPIAFERIPSIIAASDVVILPTYYDNFPFAVLEAMASGVPVIASEFGGIPEAIESGKNGVLVPAGDLTALGAALIRLLSDAQERRRLGANARRTAIEKFGWESVADRTRSVYDSAIGS